MSSGRVAAEGAYESMDYLAVSVPVTTTSFVVLSTWSELVANFTDSVKAAEVLEPSEVTGLKSMVSAQLPPDASDVLEVQLNSALPLGKSTG